MTDDERAAFFPLPLVVTPFDNGRKARLVSDFKFVDNITGRVYLVRAGESTDWNSTPMVAWSIFPPWMYPEAGLIHDHLYRHPQATITSTGATVTLSRHDCDNVHSRLMQLADAPPKLVEVAYHALRGPAGQIAWDLQRRRDTPSVPPADLSPDDGQVQP